MSDKTVSIIIPAYNAGKYLGECVDSLINQTYTNLEIIIINDGSKDDTPDVANRLAEKDRRVRVIHQPNGGLPNARNAGLREISGDYVMFMDADDWLDPDCCRQAVEMIERERADLLFFGRFDEYENGSKKDKTVYSEDLLFEKEKREDFFLYDMRSIHAWGKVYSASLVSGVFFDEKMRTAEDAAFNFPIYDKVSKAVYLSRPLLHYRILPKSAIHGFDPEVREKFDYPLKSLSDWGKTDETHACAYYSFAAIAYMVICQNGICLDEKKSLGEKLSAIRDLGKDPVFSDLFKNSDKIRIPLSRKMLVLFGKAHLHLPIAAVIALKKRAGK